MVKRRRTFSRRGKLAASCEPVCHETLEQDGGEVGTSEVDSGCMPSRPRTNNDLDMIMYKSRQKLSSAVRTFRGGDVPL